MSCKFGDERLPERFWSKVYPEPNTGCWLWGGFVAPNGYGSYWADGTNCHAHRYIKLKEQELESSELVVDHLCKTRDCVNPEHLDLVTQKENIKRGDTGTHPNTGSHNRNKTRCPQGHEYSLDNTFVVPKTGHRKCITCKRERNREYMRKYNARKSRR